MLDPLCRYVRNTGAFREAMKQQNAIAAGPWVLSAFLEPGKLPMQLNPLRILMYEDASWGPIADILETEGYQLCASPEGLMLCRQGGDDILIQLYDKQDLEKKGLPSLEAYVVWASSSTQAACFMTWEHAVCLCPELTLHDNYLMLTPSDGELDTIKSQNEENRLKRSGYKSTTDTPREVLELRRLGDSLCRIMVVGDQAVGDQAVSDQPFNGIFGEDWEFSFKERLLSSVPST